MDDRSFLIDMLGRTSEALSRAGIPYALAGGLAYSALVEPRATVDIDLLVLSESASLHTITAALAPLFDDLLPHEEVMEFPKARIWRVVGVQGTRELVVDFLMGESDFHGSAIERRLSLSFCGHGLQIVTLEDLYLLKLLSDRPQDRVDIATIEALRGNDLDKAYIDHWKGRAPFS